jgi:hypothetical protein
VHTGGREQLLLSRAAMAALREWAARDAADVGEWAPAGGDARGGSGTALRQRFSLPDEKVLAQQLVDDFGRFPLAEEAAEAEAEAAARRGGGGGAPSASPAAGEALAGIDAATLATAAPEAPLVAADDVSAAEGGTAGGGGASGGATPLPPAVADALRRGGDAAAVATAWKDEGNAAVKRERWADATRA